MKDQNKVMDIVAAKLAALPVYDDPMPSDVAQRELLELVIYANEVPAVAKVLQEFLNRGAPILRSNVDALATASTGKVVLTYHVEDAMKRLLLTCRAGNFINGELQNINGHVTSVEMANVM